MDRNVDSERIALQTGAAREDSNILLAEGWLDAAKERTELRLEDGRVVSIPTALLLAAAEAGERGRSAAGEQAGAGAGEGAGEIGAGEGMTIPVVEERLVVGRKVMPTARVLLEKHVHEYEETLDIPLAVRTFDIERVVMNEPVATAPGVRVEGETTIYPIVEEQLVVTSQLILKEELRVTRRDTERRDQRTVTLKRESVTVVREPTGKGEPAG